MSKTVESLYSDALYRKARTALVAYIDSRAPAAQASATIQAAPDLSSLRIHTGRDLQGAWLADQEKFVKLSDVEALLVATIQEPVMVAEPVGKRVTLEELHAVICEDGKVGNYLALSIAEKVMKMLPAAQMVADPAGVAVIERAIRFIDTGSHTQIARDTMMNELRKLLKSAALATTVKAVPSETPAPLKHIPTNDLVYAEVKKSVVNSSFYVSSNAVNDVMAAVRRLVIAKERS